MIILLFVISTIKPFPSALFLVISFIISVSFYNLCCFDEILFFFVSREFLVDYECFFHGRFKLLFR